MSPVTVIALINVNVLNVITSNVATGNLPRLVNCNRGPASNIWVSEVLRRCATASRNNGDKWRDLKGVS